MFAFFISCILLRSNLKYCKKPITSESGTSKSGKVVRYYKCGLKKSNAKLCHKSPIRKEVLEQLIIDTTKEVLNNPKTLDLITTKIFEAREQRVKDISILNLLEDEQKKLQKALNNILNAIEQGIITNSTKQRIEELETALEIANEKVLLERSKNKIQLSPTDIRNFISKAINKEPHLMIRLLIKEIILYDDKVEVYYNFIDKKQPDDLEHQAFCVYSKECTITPQDFGLYRNVKKYIFTFNMYF